MNQERINTLKIFVILSIFSLSDSPTGIGHYALNLLEGFRQIGKLGELHLLVDSRDEKECQKMFPEAELTVVPSFLPPSMGFWPGTGSSWRLEFIRLFLKDRLGIPWLLRKEKKGILFHPFNAMSVHVSNKLHTVITVHDLFYRNYPQVHSRKMKMMLDYCYRSIIFMSGHIIVPSEFVKKDIRKHFPAADMERIQVIYNPVVIRSSNDEEVDVPMPYLLSVNSLQGHKNLKTLVKAFSLIENSTPHHLVLVGSGNRHDEEKLTQLIQQHGAKKIVRTGYVSEGQRNYLYQHAGLFISPSCHEGFGMTPIEAALFKVPILVTRETSLPEATKGLAAYYGPADDEKALADKIAEVLEKPPSEEELEDIRAIYEECYAPQATAWEYDRLFQRLIQSQQVLSGDHQKREVV